MPPEPRPPESSSVATTKSMKGNKAKDTKPELLVRRLLRESGFPGYRLHWKKAPGRPDIAYPGRKLAIFVNGCYWHDCPHCGRKIPKSHPGYWEAKFAANRERDARKAAQLGAAGWEVLVVWECELKANSADVGARLAGALAQRDAATATGRRDASRGASQRDS